MIDDIYIASKRYLPVSCLSDGSSSPSSNINKLSASREMIGGDDDEKESAEIRVGAFEIYSSASDRQRET
ncbi:hypothetical protein NC653_029368 [Populus alba x Populus x berolinensis]|uniref:Uncharacterized protein n=1 Tax=Populus alba x Populus x berolinensis TaxID=444605 RepID=A0AAD6Q3A0_9ROSI|nr:hypothetical protein NC653_029368 [Populus alba x Populus x berolinensis]